VLEIQGTAVSTRDDHAADGRNLLNLTPTIKLGALKGLQIDVSAPYAVGDQRTANQGGGSLDAIWNFLPISDTLPALAVQPGYQTPYGAGHKSGQYFLRGLATQRLGTGEKAPRLHLNLNWTHVQQPSSTGRREVLEMSVAFSTLLTDKTALVLDVVHGAKTTVRQNQTIVEAGLKWELSDTWALTGGVGVGLGQDSPAFRVIFGFARDVSLF